MVTSGDQHSGSPLSSARSPTLDPPFSLERKVGEEVEKLEVGGGRQRGGPAGDSVHRILQISTEFWGTSLLACPRCFENPGSPARDVSASRSGRGRAPRVRAVPAAPTSHHPAFDMRPRCPTKCTDMLEFFGFKSLSKSYKIFPGEGLTYSPASKSGTDSSPPYFW